MVNRIIGYSTTGLTDNNIHLKPKYKLKKVNAYLTTISLYVPSTIQVIVIAATVITWGCDCTTGVCKCHTTSSTWRLISLNCNRVNIIIHYSLIIFSLTNDVDVLYGNPMLW